MAEWLIARHLTAVGSGLAQVTCETNQVLLVVVERFFSVIFCFRPTLRLTRFKLSEIMTPFQSPIPCDISGKKAKRPQ